MSKFRLLQRREQGWGMGSNPGERHHKYKCLKIKGKHAGTQKPGSVGTGCTGLSERWGCRKRQNLDHQGSCPQCQRWARNALISPRFYYYASFYITFTKSTLRLLPKEVLLSTSNSRCTVLVSIPSSLFLSESNLKRLSSKKEGWIVRTAYCSLSDTSPGKVILIAV